MRTGPEIRAIYARLLNVANQLGPYTEEPKKTSIHLVRRTAFAGVAARKTGILLTLKADRDIPSARLTRREQASKNRWHLVVRLGAAAEVDAEIIQWLRQAYALAE